MNDFEELKTMNDLDPTYISDEIKANKEWELAFFLSELMNDDAPVGWGKYIPYARSLLDRYEIL